MWSDIIQNLVSSIAESLCVNCIEDKKRNKFMEGLSQKIGELFYEYADTSLDCNEFAVYVSSPAFVEMVQHYLFVVEDDNKKALYLDEFVDSIHVQCSRVSLLEIRRFIQTLEKTYTDFLKNEITQNTEINALYQLLLMSQKVLLNQMLRSQDELKRSFVAMFERGTRIADIDIEAYHQSCKRELSRIRFTGISGVESKGSQDIDKFYVENSFSYMKPLDQRSVYTKAPRDPRFGLKDIFKGGNKIVLIGGAGLGKSTSLNYIFCNYERLYNSFGLKMKINLKDYASDISEKHHDILWCLTTEFSKHISKGKLSFDDISNLLTRYLNDGRCFVIFDALDEIPSQASRNQVRDEISGFCGIYYLNRFIISSREVGYLKNRFDRDFVHIRINEFSMKQIEKYSKNWLSFNYGNENIDFQDFWQKFKDELVRAKCQNMVKNPIILILALVIFDIENSLPNRRIEFYKKCINTFLITREDRKNVNKSEAFKNILNDNSIVPKVAHYKFDKTSEDMSYCFTLDELKESIMQALDVPSRRQWYSAVAEFAEYLINRAELIRETDENTLDFTHKTFFEYFLAVYYAQEYGADELICLLDRWIGDSNNDEMARLIIEVIVEKNNAKQHRTIMEYMFGRLNAPQNEDVFSIVVELYYNNMLQPKYHDMYFSYILRNSDVLFRAHRIERKGIEIRYNDLRTAELFMESIKRDPKELLQMIASLRNLSPQFKKHVIELSQSQILERIIQLFALLALEKKEPSDEEGQKRELLRYFIKDHLEITLGFPEVFLTIVSIAIKRDFDQLQSILDIHFGINGAYNRFLKPYSLMYLVARSCKTPEMMLLFLIVIIRCSGDEPDFLIDFVFTRSIYTDIDAEELENARMNAELLWVNLFKEPDYSHWKEWLMQKDLFSEEHNGLYSKLFDEYVSRIDEYSHQRVQYAINHRYENDDADDDTDDTETQVIA